MLSDDCRERGAIVEGTLAVDPPTTADCFSLVRRLTLKIKEIFKMCF